MQTTRRPVPSVAALKALRQLAYVASGTACGAAAIVYEERRRRILFLKKVAENGRVIKDVARNSRRGYTTAAAVAAIQSGEECFETTFRRSRRGSIADWDDEGHDGVKSDSTADENFLGATLARSDHLPSQVERGYQKLSSHNGRDKPPSTLTPQYTRTSIAQASRSLWNWQPRSRTSALSPASIAHNLASAPTQARGSDKTGSQSEMPSPTMEKDVSIEHEVAMDLDEAVRRCADTLRSGSTDLERSWSIVLEWARSNPEDDMVLAIIEAPTSMHNFAALAVHLKLPDLVLAICKRAGEESAVSFAPFMVNMILQSPHPEMFSEALLALLDRVRSECDGASLDASSLTRLRWIELELCALMQSQQDQSSASGLFSKILHSRPFDTAFLTLDGLISRLIKFNKPQSAIWLLKGCTSAAGVTKVDLEKSWQNAARLFLSDADRAAMLDVLSFMRSTGIPADKIIRSAWEACSSDVDLLDTYSQFGLDPVPSRPVLGRLFNAMLEQLSAETIKSEMIGQSRRLWTGVLAREWPSHPNVSQVLDRFWKVQDAVGQRSLSPILYETVIRRCNECGLKQQADEILAFKRGLMAGGGASQKISNLMQLARAENWEAAMKDLQDLNPKDFGNMQTQARAQMFDSLIKTYLLSKREAHELLQLGIAVFSRVHEYMTPTQALRLLFMSLVRTGQLDALVNVHSHANRILEEPMQLTPVDSVDLFRSFYYGFRPSHVNLANLMDKTYGVAWQALSKLHLPLLLVSASYTRKRDEQKRTGEETHQMIKDALLQMDDGELQNALLMEARRADAFDGTRIMQFKVTQSDQPTEDQPYATLEELLEGLETSRSNIKDTGSQRVSTVADLAPPPLYSPPPTVQESSVTSTSELLHAVESQESHFAHARTKSLLHQPVSHIGSFIQGLDERNAFAPSAAITSLAAHSQVTDAAAVRSLLDGAGSDGSLRRSRHMIARLQGANIDAKDFCSVESIANLKALITKEYQRLEQSGHIPDHSLATSIAQIMLSHEQPAAAVEVLRHALSSTWGTIIEPGTGPMLMLLRAYIAVGRLDGVRWVIGYMITHGVRIERNLITALKDGRRQWALRRPVGAGSCPVEELARLHKMCIEQQARQIAHARDVGDKLVAYIGKHAAPAEKVQWTADDEFVGSDCGGRREFREAVFVHSVCADVLTMARQSHTADRKHKETDLRLVRAMRRVQRNREMRMAEIDVGA